MNLSPQPSPAGTIGIPPPRAFVVSRNGCRADEPLVSREQAPFDLRQGDPRKHRDGWESVGQHAPLFITRNGQQTIVILSLEHFASLEETACLLRAPGSARRPLRWGRQGFPGAAVLGSKTGNQARETLISFNNSCG